VSILNEIRGLRKFKEYFKDYHEQYILIGGTACFIHLTNNGLNMRVTKDYDVVLSLGALTKEFILKLHEFIVKAEYNTMECGSASENLYRFSNPKEKEFPEQIELLVPISEMVDEIFSPGEITYVKVEDKYTSLSAILLDKVYFDFLYKEKELIHGLSVANVNGLIILKIKAWLNLREDKALGLFVNTSDIKKHRTDVYRLYQVIDPIMRSKVNNKISNDILEFCRLVDEKDDDYVLKNIGIPGRLEDVINEIKNIFYLD